MVPIAHAADWISMAVFLFPAAAVGIWVGIGRLRERLRGGREAVRAEADVR